MLRSLVGSEMCIRDRIKTNIRMASDTEPMHSRRTTDAGATGPGGWRTSELSRGWLRDAPLNALRRRHPLRSHRAVASRERSGRVTCVRGSWVGFGSAGTTRRVVVTFCSVGADQNHHFRQHRTIDRQDTPLAAQGLSHMRGRTCPAHGRLVRDARGALMKKQMRWLSSVPFGGSCCVLACGLFWCRPVVCHLAGNSFAIPLRGSALVWAARTDRDSSPRSSGRNCPTR